MAGIRPYLIDDQKKVPRRIREGTFRHPLFIGGTFRHPLFIGGVSRHPVARGPLCNSGRLLLSGGTLE